MIPHHLRSAASARLTMLALATAACLAPHAARGQSVTGFSGRLFANGSDVLTPTSAAGGSDSLGFARTSYQPAGRSQPVTVGYQRIFTSGPGTYPPTYQYNVYQNNYQFDTYFTDFDGQNARIVGYAVQDPSYPGNLQASFIFANQQYYYFRFNNMNTYATGTFGAYATSGGDVSAVVTGYLQNGTAFVFRPQVGTPTIFTVPGAARMGPLKLYFPYGVGTYSDSAGVLHAYTVKFDINYNVLQGFLLDIPSNGAANNYGMAVTNLAQALVSRQDSAGNQTSYIVSLPYLYGQSPPLLYYTQISLAVNGTPYPNLYATGLSDGGDLFGGQIVGIASLANHAGSSAFIGAPSSTALPMSFQPPRGLSINRKAVSLPVPANRQFGPIEMTPAQDTQFVIPVAN